MKTKPDIPANRPANAVGFVCIHHRRIERLALYDLRTEDLRAGFFAREDTFDTVRETLAKNGLTLLEDGFVVTN